MTQSFSFSFLAFALALAEGCTDGAVSSPQAPAKASPPVPYVAAASTTPIRRVRRLSSREYDNVVRDLLGDTRQPANGFVHDVYPNGYDNGAVDLAVQSDQVANYQAAAEVLAASAVENNLESLVGGCDSSAQGDSACLESLLSSFAARAYRRPLTDTERQRLRDIFQPEDTANGFSRAIQTVVEVILQSPQFLYREELGAPGVTRPSGAAMPLTDDEVASELSFMLTGTIPDPELRAAVAQGRFSTADDRRREAARLLSTAGAKDTLRAFLHEWLSTNRLSGLSKDPSVYPSFNQALAASMTAELDAFYDNVLWQGTGSLREFFTSNQSFADENLDALYGLTPQGTGLLPVALDPQLRQGVLSRAGFLAVTSNTDNSGPVPRGVFVLTSLMCSPPHSPPSVSPVPPTTDSSMQPISTRQRFAQHVSTPFCAGCHSRIDGVGFGFEEFDGIGAYRQVDNGQPVDDSGTILGTGEIDGDFVGVAGLTAKLAASRVLADCYARQAYRFAMGDVESSGDTLAWLTPSTSPDANITDALLAIIASPDFVTRRFE